MTSPRPPAVRRSRHPLVGARRAWLPRRRPAVGAGHHHPRLEHGVHRRLCRERRPARHSVRSGHVGVRRAVGGQRLHADAERAHSRRRCRGRPVRPAARLRDRYRGVHRRVGGLRPGARRGDADRRAGRAGGRRRAAGAEQPRDHQRRLSGGGTRPRDRHLGRLLRAYDGAGPGARRVAGGRVVLAADLPGERADRRGGPAARAACPREPRRVGRAAGLARRAAGGGRTRRHRRGTDGSLPARLASAGGVRLTARRRVAPRRSSCATRPAPTARWSRWSCSAPAPSPAPTR